MALYGDLDDRLRRQLNAIMDIAYESTDREVLQNSLQQLQALLVRTEKELPGNELYWSNGYSQGLGLAIPMAIDCIHHALAEL